MIKKKSKQEDMVHLADCEKGIHCSHCNNGCKLGSGAFAQGQLQAAAKFLNTSIEELKNKFLAPVTRFNTTLHRPKIEGTRTGQCIFYKEGSGCKIYPVRPVECMIAAHNEQGDDLHMWFTVNHFVDPTDSVSLREWDVQCKLMETIIPGATVEELVPDKQKRDKILRFEVQR